MGSKTINPVTPLITGASLTRVDTGGTSETIIIAATTAQSALDLSKLVVVFENYSSTASCVITLNVGDDYSEVSQGAGTALTIATGTSALYTIAAFGGKSFESARFLQNDSTYKGKAVFTVTTAGTVYVSAYMLP